MSLYIGKNNQNAYLHIMCSRTWKYDKMQYNGDKSLYLKPWPEKAQYKQNK